MGEAEETRSAEIPNGPATVTDNKKDRFKLEYGGLVIFQATVKLLRDEAEITFKAAGARLFVVSKFDGWDVVTQTVRIAAVGSRPADRLIVRGHAADSGTPISTSITPDETGADAIYSSSHDCLISVEPGPTVTIACEDVPVKATPDANVQHIVLHADGPEIILKFRPYYRRRHGVAIS
jgi:hypothetical protein